MLVRGRRVGDIAFGSGSDLLLSQAFVDAWYSDGLRGLGTVDPVQIETVQPQALAESLSGFHHMVAQREGAAIDPEESHIVRSGASECGLCGGAGLVEAILRIRISEDSWKGADLFVPWGLHGIIVATERVADLALKYDLANVTTTPVEEYRWNPLRREANRGVS